MKRLASSGQCNLCNQTFSKATMTRHLSGCGAAHTGENSSKVQSFHLLVEGGYPKIYWLHLAVPTSAPLSAVDKFLRKIWLECCGHLSAFTISGSRYSARPMQDDFSSGPPERRTNVPVSQVLIVGSTFSYEYDYGSTTELSLKVVGLVETSGKPKEIRLLARNDAPQIMCGECGDAATQVCTQCIWEGNGWRCDDCIEDHECGEEMFLPVVNSPRVGVCGYSG